METKTPGRKLITRCVKCGTNNASVKYIGSVVTEVQSVGSRHVCVTNEDQEDALIMTCSECGYAWIEKPLDSKE